MMLSAKSCVLFLFLSGITIGLSGNAFGQEREITAKEFYAAQRVPIDKLPEKSYRLVAINDIFLSGNASEVFSTKATFEMIYPTKTRIVIESHGNPVRERTEMVSANGWVYERKGTGNWTRERRSSEIPDISTLGIGTTGMSDQDEKVEYKYKFLGRSMVDGQPLSLYEMSNPRLPYTKSTYYYRVWVDDNGFPVRALHEMINDKGAVTMRGTSVYDYTTPIIIDEPKIQPTRKRHG